MTSRIVKTVVAAAFCTLLCARPAHAQRTIGVTGPDGQLTTVNLGEFPRQTVVTGDRGRKATFEGVAFTDQIILLADRRDDGPLLPDTGPLQLVVPHDKRPARWVRQVAKIEVRDVE